MPGKTTYSKDFVFVAIGQIISVFGNQILRYALSLYPPFYVSASAVLGICFFTGGIFREVDSLI